MVQGSQFHGPQLQLHHQALYCTPYLASASLHRNWQGNVSRCLSAVLYRLPFRPQTPREDLAVTLYCYGFWACSNCPRPRHVSCSSLLYMAKLPNWLALTLNVLVSKDRRVLHAQPYQLLSSTSHARTFLVAVVALRTHPVSRIQYTSPSGF